ncbi:MAG: hypothetical protein CMJ78_21050 [Planctomycetaceae bacterium]|nr:hypothetical protein [Planctomycetaceae bacterium]
MIQRLLSQLVLPVIVIGLGVGGLLWLSAKETPPDRVASQPPPLLVETIALPTSVTAFPIQGSGNVVPHREVTLSAEVAGAIIAKGETIESGRHVRAGTPLLQIDPQRFELQVNELDSELKQVAADIKQLQTEESGLDGLIKLAQQELKIAEIASKRLTGLATKNAITDSEREAVERTELQARNALRLLENRKDAIPIRRERLEAQRKLTEFQRDQAQLNLTRTGITAPFDGIITVVAVEKGNYVQTGDMLLKLEDTSSVDVECSLRMEDLYWLWTSESATPQRSRTQSVQPASVSNANQASNQYEVPAINADVSCEIAGEKFHWNGVLSRYENGGVDRKTRTIACRVTVTNPLRKDSTKGPPTLMRGMFVTVTLRVTPKDRLWRIPNRAVQPNGQVWSVKDERLRVHRVQKAKMLPDAVLVRAQEIDLQQGDRISVTQLVTPVDGSQVRELKIDDAVAPAQTREPDSDEVRR